MRDRRNWIEIKIDLLQRADIELVAIKGEPSDDRSYFLCERSSRGEREIFLIQLPHEDADEDDQKKGEKKINALLFPSSSQHQSQGRKSGKEITGDPDLKERQENKEEKNQRRKKDSSECQTLILSFQT